MPRDTWLKFDTEGNRHVTAYLSRNGARLFADSRYDPEIRSIVVGPKSRCAEKVLRDFARAWAEDMRQADRDGELPADGGISWFADCMQRAEAEIARQDTTPHSDVEADGAGAKAPAPEPSGTQSCAF